MTLSTVIISVIIGSIILYPKHAVQILILLILLLWTSIFFSFMSEICNTGLNFNINEVHYNIKMDDVPYFWDNEN